MNGVKFGGTFAGHRPVGNPELSPLALSASKGRCLSMAIGTQQAQVNQPVVCTVATDVIQFQRNWFATPSPAITPATAVREDALLQ